ncbi:MAG: phosphate transport system permease protein [Solirubrobacteraceae bacterium]|jgi:phosphate transport system permease protein|nr:phosphate transport system permease protein [Solirubrobacteraceae bacterium]
MTTNTPKDPPMEPEVRPDVPPADARTGQESTAVAESRTTGPAVSAGPVTARPSITGGSLPANAAQGITLLAAVLAVIAIVATDISPIPIVLAAFALALGVVYTWSRVVEGPRRATDRAVTIAVTSAFLLALLPLVSVLYTVVDRGLPRFDSGFFTESARNVVGAGGGAYHAIIGTLVITLCASIISVPIGILAAIYLHEYGRGPLKRWLTFFVDVMTGIPSIVAGLFAFALFSIFLGPGIRLGIMGAVALSVLMIPIVVRSTEEMLKIVPNSLRESSMALGVPKWRTITKVVLPTALAGIVTGVMVSIARIMGETAPLLIATGTFSSVNWNPFDGRMENLPVFAFNQYKNPGVLRDAYFDRAWAAALTLIVIVMVLNLAARLLYRRFGTEIRR